MALNDVFQLWRHPVLMRLPWRRTVAVAIVALVPLLAVAVPAWCFGAGMW